MAIGDVVRSYEFPHDATEIFGVYAWNFLPQDRDQIEWGEPKVRRLMDYVEINTIVGMVGIKRGFAADIVEAKDPTDEEEVIQVVRLRRLDPPADLAERKAAALAALDSPPEPQTVQTIETPPAETTLEAPAPEVAVLDETVSADAPQVTTEGHDGEGTEPQ